MSVYKLILIFFLLLAGQARADEWTTADTRRQLVYTTLVIIDWGQTLDMVSQQARQDNIRKIGDDRSAPPTYTELNPLLGPHPTRGRVNAFCAGSIALNYLIAQALPTKWRARFQYASIGIETIVVANNFRIGLRVEF